MKSLLRMLETRHGHSAIHLMLQLAPRCSQVPVSTIASNFSERTTGGDVPTQRVAAVCLGRLVMDQDHEDTIALRNQPVQGKKYESEDGQAARHDRGEGGRSLGRELQQLIAEDLSDRQRQVVSQHLYGKQRDGKNVGGALSKLRRACGERGIDWP